MQTLEKLCLDLAAHTDTLVIQKMPQGWRFVLPAPNLNKPFIYYSIRRFRQISGDVFMTDYEFTKNAISHSDPWVRSMKWAITVAKIVGVSQKEIINAQKRLKWADALETASRKWQTRVLNAYYRVMSSSHPCFNPNAKFPPITVCLNSWNLFPGKAGGYETPAQKQYGILTIHPGVFIKNISYEHVVAHELIHALLADCSIQYHNQIYEKIAKAINLRGKYLHH